jgi:hypothetical protein
LTHKQANPNLSPPVVVPKPVLGLQERLEAIRQTLVQDLPRYHEAKKAGPAAQQANWLGTALMLRINFPGSGCKGDMTLAECNNVLEVSTHGQQLL